MMRVLRYIKRKLTRLWLWVQYFFAVEKLDMDTETAFRILNEYHPMPSSSAVVPERHFEAIYDLAIIIPAYNSERWIKECMDSVVHQTERYTLQIIVVNDGSTDKTGEILEAYRKYPSVQIIHQQNRGYSGARNTAIREVKSKYIMFVDSDDLLPQNAVNFLMDKAVQEDADIVEGNGLKFNEQGLLGPIKKVNDREHLWGGPCLKVIRTKLFNRVQFPEGFLYEDTIIPFLIIPQANKIVVIDTEVYEYRIHASSITQSTNDNPNTAQSFWIIELIKNDAKKIGMEIPNTNDALFEHIVITQKRCRFLPDEIQKSIFILTKTFINNYSAVHYKTKRLSKAIHRNNYLKYRLLCKLW